MGRDYDRRIMRWLADAVYLVIGWLYLPVVLYQALVLRKNRTGWGERFGGVPVFPSGTPRIWVHAVSLGEVNATPKLIEMLRRRIPDCHVVVSTTTDTGFARAVSLYGRSNVFRYPLDFSLAVDRALDRVQPSMIVLVELELWYNLVRRAVARGVDVVVVNGRLTEHSARRFALLRRILRPMFKSLTWVGAQDDDYAERFRQLGVDPARVEVTSSLKWDSAGASDAAPDTDGLAAAVGIDRTDAVWVCGSTGPKEEELVLDAFDAVVKACHNTAPRVRDAAQNRATRTGTPRLVIVPRKPERFDEVAALVERRGYACVRRSACPDGTSTELNGDRAGTVIVGDTLGELRKFYALADVVFVGRTLVPLGGSDPMEVAALGKPAIVGPYADNFRSPVRALRDAHALAEVRSAAELAELVVALLANDTERMEMGARARDVVAAHQGATERTVNRLVVLMERRK